MKLVDYTVRNVNHNPTIIYGTFDGQIVFFEASITLYALQDAIRMAQQNKKVKWQILQPQAYQYNWWPKILSLEYIEKNKIFILRLT